MRATVPKYRALDELIAERDAIEWYWRLIALSASWMILGGFLMLPGTFDEDPKLRFSKQLLVVFVIILLSAGILSTALVFAACRNSLFLAETVFLPTLTSCAIGLLTILYSFVSSTRYKWGSPAIAGTAVGASAFCIYSLLFFLAHRKISHARGKQYPQGRGFWQAPGYYHNYIANEYPTVRDGKHSLLTDEDMTRQQMINLLMKNDPGPSPDAATFRIDLPAEDEDPLYVPPGHPSHDVYAESFASRSQNLLPRAWRQQHGRNLSREERRRQIELGLNR